MTRHILTYIALLSLPLAANAQETRDLVIDDSIQISHQSPVTQELMPSLPKLNEYGQVTSLHFPYMGFNYWPTWRLHEGVNASLGLSVFSTFGSGHTWSGAGFSENASLMYAMPLGKK